MQQGKKNEMLRIILHTDFPTSKHTNRGTESQRP